MKNLPAKIADANSFSQPANKNSTQKKVWSTNLKDARNAENWEDKTTAQEEEKCTMPFVQNAVRKLRFRLNRLREKKFIVKIVFHR